MNGQARRLQPGCRGAPCLADIARHGSSHIRKNCPARITSRGISPLGNMMGNIRDDDARESRHNSAYARGCRRGARTPTLRGLVEQKVETRFVIPTFKSREKWGSLPPPMVPIFRSSMFAPRSCGAKLMLVHATKPEQFVRFRFPDPLTRLLCFPECSMKRMR
jgi:hypothetical protein